MGLGIRRTLSAVRGAIASTTPGFIRHALDGASSRSGNAIGLGLGRIEKIATTSGGCLYIRSGDGGILAHCRGRDPYARLADLPGTHISITFRSAR
jgi:hypothetical protein